MFITYSKKNKKKSLFLAIALLTGIVGSTLIQDKLSEDKLLVNNDCGCEIESVESKEAGFCFNLLIWNSCKPKGERWFWK